MVFSNLFPFFLTRVKSWSSPVPTGAIKLPPSDNFSKKYTGMSRGAAAKRITSYFSELSSISEPSPRRSLTFLILSFFKVFLAFSCSDSILSIE